MEYPQNDSLVSNFPKKSMLNYPYILFNRRYTGYGQHHGGFIATLTNRHPNQAVTAIYFDSVPWFIRMFLHTLEISLNETTTIQGIVKCNLGLE